MLYERYAVGFATQELIDTDGRYTLDNIATSNKGYRINTPQDKEYFLLENRQQDNKKQVIALSNAKRYSFKRKMVLFQGW